MVDRVGTRGVRAPKNCSLVASHTRDPRSSGGRWKRRESSAEWVHRCGLQRVGRGGRLRGQIEPCAGTARDRSGNPCRWRGRTVAQPLIRALARAPLESLEAKSWRHYLTRASGRSTKPAPSRSAGFEVAAPAVRVFVRQPFTRTHARERMVVQGVLDVLRRLDGRPHRLHVLTGWRAESSQTFRARFELNTGLAFTPRNFRAARLEWLNQAEAMVVIRTGLSESGAFELAYNIFGGGGEFPSSLQSGRELPSKRRFFGTWTSSCQPATPRSPVPESSTISFLNSSTHVSGRALAIGRSPVWRPRRLPRATWSCAPRNCESAMNAAASGLTSKHLFTDGALVRLCQIRS